VENIDKYQYCLMVRGTCNVTITLIVTFICHRAGLYGTILNCTVQYCTVLYCTVPYHTLPYCTYRSVLYCVVAGGEGDPAAVPTGAQLFREAAEETTVGAIRVPREQIMIPLMLLQRNPEYFPDPGEPGPGMLLVHRSASSILLAATLGLLTMH